MKIIVNIPLTYNAINWYRGINTYRYIADCTTTNEPMMTWDKLIGVDVLVVIRPDKKESVESINMAKQTGVLTIVDYDDDILNLNPCSPAYERFVHPDYVKITINSLKNCDIVTVSTQAIADSFVSKGIDAKKIYIIPNAYNDFHKPFKPKLNYTDRFLLRGDTFSHSDILTQFNELKAASNKFKLIGLGDHRTFFDHLYFYEAYDYLTPPFYFDYLPQLICRVMCKPMSKNLFNKSKSNCSWLEATSGGMVLVAPEHFPEFDKPGIVAGDFFDIEVTRLMEDDDFCEEMFNSSVNYIRENLLLSKVNELRKEILRIEK